MFLYTQDSCSIWRIQIHDWLVRKNEQSTLIDLNPIENFSIILKQLLHAGGTQKTKFYRIESKQKNLEARGTEILELARSIDQTYKSGQKQIYKFTFFSYYFVTSYWYDFYRKLLGWQIS